MTHLVCTISYQTASKEFLVEGWWHKCISETIVHGPCHKHKVGQHGFAPAVLGLLAILPAKGYF